MWTSRSAFGNGNGLRSTALTTLKMVAFAPMASASVATTTNVKPGARARLRAAWVKSLIHRSSVALTCYLFVFPEGLRPSDSPTRALARRFVGSLRARGSLAALARMTATGYVAFAASTLARPANDAVALAGHLAVTAGASAQRTSATATNLFMVILITLCATRKFRVFCTSSTSA